MSNFNLVSDQNNGHRYTAYFGEEIVVPEGSKCYLNFASLFREGGVNLTETETIRIESSDDILPEKLVATDSTLVDNKIDETFEIKKGKYTYQQLQAAFVDGFNTIRQKAGSSTGPLYYYSPIFSGDQQEDATLEIGAHLDLNIWNNGEGVKTPVQTYLTPGTAFNNTSGAQGSYKKAANVGTTRDGTATTSTSICDNFALSDTSFFHRTLQPEPRDYPLGSFIEVDFNNLNESSIFFGLYGDEFGKLPEPVLAEDTVGSQYPKLVSVIQNPQYFNTTLFPGGDTDMTRWRGGASSLTQGAAPEYAWEGFGMTLDSNTATTPASFYPVIDEFAMPVGVMNYDFTLGPGIQNLAPNTLYVLTQQSTSGSGAGIEIRATSTPLGGIFQGQIDASEITVPGDGFSAYIEGDTIILEEITQGTGTVTITVTEVSKHGAITGGYLRVPDKVSARDPSPVTAFSLGSGFQPTQDAALEQLTGTASPINPTGYQIGPNDCQASVMIPAAFLILEIEGENEKRFFPHTSKILNVYMAEDSSGYVIGEGSVNNNDWESQNVGIAKMRKIGSTAITSLATVGKLRLQTFVSGFPGSYEDTPDIYFHVYDSNSENPDVPILRLFQDSYLFPHDFFTGVPFDDQPTTNLTNLEVQKSQYPLKILQATRNLGDQILRCKYPQFNPSTAGTNGESIDSMINSLTWTFSDTMAKLLGIDGNTKKIYPSGTELEKLTFYDSEIILTWRNSSYYIEIEELPINNWKNKRTDNDTGTGKQKKGVKKNILASIPLPFASSLTEVTSASTLLIGGTYDPPKMVISDLLNQKLSTNRMSVRIYRMEDDKEATEIIQSVVNFTIFKN